MGTCSGCEMKKRLTSRGLVYTHPNPLLPGEECSGSRKPVKAIIVAQEAAQDLVVEAAAEAVGEAVRYRKTGYTDEDLDEMLRDLTPKRQRFRERVSGWLHRKRGCCD